MKDRILNIINKPTIHIDITNNLHSASSMGSDVVCNSGVVGRLVQLPAVQGYGHDGQVADKYLCPVVGKQPRDYNVDSVLIMSTSATALQCLK